MRHCARIAALAFAASTLCILQGCSTPVQRAAVVSSDRIEIARIASQFRAIALRAGETSPCTERNEPPPGPPHQNWKRCYVEIEITPYTAQNGIEYCLARLGERIVFPFSDRDKKKLVVFELNPTSLGSVRYEFHDQQGILLFSNAGGDVTKGGHGNGDVVDRSKFHVENKHSKAGDALYLPVILQVDGVGAPMSVCGAADPKIINN